MNTEMATTLLSQFTSPNCPIINTPTITNASAVTGEVNKLKTNGAKNIEKINKIPVTTETRPVLPPSPIPAALSTKAVTVLVPQIDPIIPPSASLKNAFSIPTA